MDSIDTLRAQRAAACETYWAADARLQELGRVTPCAGEIFWASANCRAFEAGDPAAVAKARLNNQRMHAFIAREDAERDRKRAAAETMARIDRRIAALA